MSKLSVSKRACIAFVFCAATAIAMPAQTTTVATPAPVFITLHSFDGTDGINPVGLVQGTNGKFYGTTAAGGSNACMGGCGGGFSITLKGALTTLIYFGYTDGANPHAALVQGTNGMFYGTTPQGGAHREGTVFSIAADGAFKLLYSFCSQSNCSDGQSPNAALVQGTDGNFYGTTVNGGASGDGTVFSITAGGTLTTLHSFNGTDGFQPVAGLVEGTDGSFYGTTQHGGAVNVYDGTVFSITAGGTLTTLHSFAGFDGAGPNVVLVLGTDGKFYGTTVGGGTNGYLVGTVFSITTSGIFRTHYNFCSQTNCLDGFNPTGLVQDTNGKFYGTTLFGGTSNDGTVFRLAVRLGPFVKTNPTAAKVGTAVTILGTSLTGATSVTFNGTAATIIKNTSSYITTTVPTGATTGTVQVVTPRGTLSSNVPFRVLP